MEKFVLGGKVVDPLVPFNWIAWMSLDTFKAIYGFTPRKGSCKLYLPILKPTG